MLRCLYCHQLFTPSIYHRNQKVCSRPGCQTRRRQDSRQAQLTRDRQYRDTCQDSRRKWREQHGAAYMRQYRQDHPTYTTENCRQQSTRDRRRQARNLVKNNVALDLKTASREVFLISPSSADLVKNNSAFWAKVLIFNPVIPPTLSSCKEQRSGLETGLAL
jgi:hypothetical protein